MRRPEGPQPRHRRWARAAAGVVAAAAVISVLHQAWAGVADVEIAALEPGHQAQQARFAPTLPPPCPSSRFLLLFSGHQGSSAIAAMLAALPEVFVPGFEPLDAPGLSPAQKLAFMEAAFTFPATPTAFAAWRRELLPAPHIRVNRTLVRDFGQLEGKTVAGFKLRPYAGAGNQSHTAMTGLDPAAVRALLRRYNVSLLLTLRRNRVKEALSWYKARELGLRQFNAVKAQRHLGVPQLLQGPAAPGPQPPQHPPAGPVAVNVTALLGWLAYVDWVNGALLNATVAFQRPKLTIFYEDFLADPLSVVAEAARFIGADPSRLRPSSRFTKQAPDDLRTSVANFEELCSDLVGTSYFRFLEVEACPQVAGSSDDATENSSSSSNRGVEQLSKAIGSSSNSTLPAGGARQVEAASSSTQGLLQDWCPEVDKRATGWQGLSAQECMQRAAQSKAAAVQHVREGRGTLMFKHVHKAGGSTLCRLAQRNMVAEVAQLPGRSDGWDTNCVPYEAFLGPHPAVGLGSWQAAPVATGGSSGSSNSNGGGLGGAGSNSSMLLQPAQGLQAPAELRRQLLGDAHAPSRSLRARHWLGGACWLGFLAPAQLRALPQHFRPLTFVASEGPLPDALPLDPPFAMVTMLRHPWDRTLSAYRWWQLMTQRMPGSPAECRAYAAPANASLEAWLDTYPDNWMTRELVGAAALFRSASTGQLLRLGPEHLNLAKQRLHSFAAVLILERWDEAATTLQRVFGWADIDFQKHRSGSAWNSTAERELPEPALAKLKAANTLDLELYRYAQRLAEAGGG